jgi:hypothetical protein
MAFAAWLLSFLAIASTIPVPFISALQSRNPLYDLETQLFSCPAASWPYASPGSLIQPQLPDAELQSLLSQVSTANIEATIRKLVTFGTRHTLSTQTDPNRGIGAAKQWLASQYHEVAAVSNGHMTVDVISYIQEPDGDRILFPVNISDIVATLKGSEDPERVYVRAAHSICPVEIAS